MENVFATVNGRPRILGPDGNPIPPAEPAISHVYTFASLWNSATRAYSYRWDEAIKQSRENALSMRRDCFLMSLLRERQYPTSQMSWHIEPGNKKDPAQAEEANFITDIIQQIPDLEQMFNSLLEAIWYGRAGVDLSWGWDEIQNHRAYLPCAFVPVNGDKIQFSWSGDPRIFVWAGMLGGGLDLSDPDISYDYNNTRMSSEEVSSAAMRDRGTTANIVWTDLNPALELRNSFWRNRFIIHKHDLVDADFFEADMAGGIHGVGVRHWIYWMDWMKKEILSWLMDYMERTGLGLTIYYYDESNPKAMQQAQQAAKEDGRNTVIVWPRAAGGEKVATGIERIETNTQGVNFILQVIEGYFDQKIERFIIGQTMSGGDDKETGLGGTGRAQLAANTKYRIIRHDAMKLGGTLTQDLVKPLQKYNMPNSKFRHKFVFDVDMPDPKEKMDGAKSIFDMGGAIKKSEAYAIVGFSIPAADDDVLVKSEPQQPGQPGQPGQQQQQPLPGIPGLPGVHGQVPLSPKALPWMKAGTEMQLPFMNGRTPAPSPDWMDARKPVPQQKPDWLDARTSLPQQALNSEREIPPQFYQELETEAPSWGEIVTGKAEHLRVLGESGSGKTTLATAITSQLPGKVFIIDPVYTPGSWGGLPAVTVDENGDYGPISRAIDRLFAELKRRSKMLQQGHTEFERLTVVMDEVPSIVAEVKQAGLFIRRMAQRGRHVNMHLMGLSQSDRVGSWGMEGFGDVFSNFATIYLGGMAADRARRQAAQTQLY